MRSWLRKILRPACPDRPAGGRQAGAPHAPRSGWLSQTLAFLLFLIIFLPGVCFSQDSSTPSGRVPVPDLGKLSKGKEPVNITADQLEYDQQKNIYTANGHAVVIQGQMRLTAESVVLDNTTGLLTAERQVELLDGNNLVKGDRIEFNVNTSRGVIYKGRIDTKKENYHIEGERMERLTEEEYLIDDGSWTTCDSCPSSAPAWRFRAKRLRLRLDHYGVAKGAALYIKDVPVIYLPYIVFPVRTTRQSGFLLPRMGYSTRQQGFNYLQPFYWAIGYSQDATLSLDYRSIKGVGGNLEYRYVLSRTAQGRLDSMYFHDRTLEKDLLDLRYRHSQQFTQSLNLKADVNYLNREDVRSELSSVTAERTQISTESNLVVHYRGDLHSLSFLTRYTQDLVGSNSTTLQRLPELDYALTEFPIRGLPVLFGSDFSMVNFWRRDELENPTDPFAAQLRALRIDLFPKVWWPLNLGGLATLTPQAGFRETYYSRGVQDQNDVHREIPYGAVVLQSPWVRMYGDYTHLVEPMVQYEYADLLQDEVFPQFDQVDLADDKRLITYGLTNRLWIDDSSILFRLTQSYNLDRSAPSLSDLRAEWQVKPKNWFWIDQDTFYTIHDHRVSSINTDAVVRWTPFFNVLAGQRYTRPGAQIKKGDVFNPISLGELTNQADKINFLTVGANLYLPWAGGGNGSGNGLYLASKGYYNLVTHGFAEIDYGLKYSSQCWEAVVDYKDFPDRNQVSFLITLKGAVTVDSRSAGGLFENKPSP